MAKREIESLGKQIASKRKQAGLSQKELADKLELSESVIQSYEQDRRNPSIPVLEKIAETLKCTLIIELK